MSVLRYICVLSSYLFFFLMIRQPPRSTRTDTLFPYTTLFRSRRQRMRPECIAAVAQVLGQAPTPAQIRNIETRLARSMRAEAAADHPAWPALPLADQLQAAAKRAPKTEARRVGKEWVSTC